jgi:hypothetical protein
VKVKVVLTDGELKEAAMAGVERRIRAMQRNLKPNQRDRPEWEQKWWQSDVIGAIGEYALSKAFGQDHEFTDWDTNGKDVLQYQVRTIENPDAGLRVRRHDNPLDTFILAQVHRNKVLLHGYATGTQVFNKGWERFPDCFEYPVEELYSMNDLAVPIVWTDSVTPMQ